MADINVGNKFQSTQMFDTPAPTTVKGGTTQAAQKTTLKEPTFQDNLKSHGGSKQPSLYTNAPHQPELEPPEPGFQDQTLNTLPKELEEAFADANKPLVQAQEAVIDQMIAKEISKDSDQVSGAEMEQAKEENVEFLKPKGKEKSEKHGRAEVKSKNGEKASIKEEKASIDKHARRFIDDAINKFLDSGDTSHYSEFSGFSKEDVKDKLFDYYFNPQSVQLASPLHALIKAIKTDVKETMHREDPELANTLKAQKEEFKSQVRISYGNSFEILLSASDAPKGDKQAVQYAFYNHKAVDGLTTSQKALFDSISSQALTETSQTHHIHKTPKVDNERYNATLSYSYTQSYESALQSSLNNGEITKDEYNALRARLYYPESVAIDAKTAALEKSIHANALNHTIEVNGIPKDWAPTVSTIMYDAVANGTYRDELKKCGDSTLAFNNTIKILGLPPTWKVTEPEEDPNLEPKIALLMKGAKSFMTDLQDAAIQIQESQDIPPQMKNSFMSYLAIIGKVLDDMQQLIYLIESSNAKLSKAMNSILLDAQINKIEKAKEEAAAQREANEAAKGKTVINVIGKILGPVLAILSVITALAMSLVPPLASLAPLLIGVAIVMVTLSISKAAGFDIMAEGFKAIDSMLETMLPDGALRLVAQAMIKAVIVATVIITCCICGPGGVLLSLNLGVEALLSSNVVSDIVEACGGGEMAQMIATMIVMVIVMVALIGVMFASMPGAAASAAGAATGAEATGAGGVTAATTTKGVVAKMKLVTEQLTKILKDFFTKDLTVIANRIKLLAATTSILASSTFKIAESAANINMYQKLAELATRIANFKADQEEIGGLIKALKMMMDALGNEIPGMSAIVKLINELQGKKYDDTKMRPIQV